ncbi:MULTISPECIES: hypothetical protein [Cupriavidus]
MMSKIIVLVAFLISIPAMGCTLGYVDYEPVFAEGRHELSAREILRLADWRARLRLRLPSGGIYLVHVRQNAGVGVSARLAEQRRRSLLSVLSNLGIGQADIEEATVRRYGEDMMPGRELRHLVNTAEISIVPRCPHPCCPGPQPKENSAGSR